LTMKWSDRIAQGFSPISANLAEDLRSWVGFLSRRDFTIVARQFIAWTAHEKGRVPEGRLIRNRREIQYA
jgi:hypothetical protein